MKPLPKLVLGLAPCTKKTCCPRLEVTNPGDIGERFDLIDDEGNVCSMSRERFLLITRSHELYFRDNPEPDSEKWIEFGKVKITLERLKELTDLYFESQNGVNESHEERVWDWSKSV